MATNITTGAEMARHDRHDQIIDITERHARDKNLHQVLHEAASLAIAEPDEEIRRHRILQSVKQRITSLPALLYRGKA
jgi:hypothetical protein